MVTLKVKRAALDGSDRVTMARTGDVAVVCPTTNPSAVTGSETVVYVSRDSNDAVKHGELWVYASGSWTVRDLGAGLAALMMRAVPGTPGTVYGWFLNYNTFATPVQKSTDYGATWSNISAPSFSDVMRGIAVGSDGYCYASGSGSAAGTSGIFKSNGGAWAQVLEGDFNGFGYGAPAYFDISGDELLWIDVSNNDAYRITSGGSQATLTDPDANNWRGLCKGGNDTLIALMDDGTNGKVYRSTDNGANWTLEQTEALMDSSGHTAYSRIRQDPRAASSWWLLADVNITAEPAGTKPHVWKSTDDGVTWTEDTPAGAGTDTTGLRLGNDLWVAG